MQCTFYSITHSMQTSKQTKKHTQTRRAFRKWIGQPGTFIREKICHSVLNLKPCSKFRSGIEMLKWDESFVLAFSFELGLNFNDAAIFSLLSVTVYGAHKGFTLTLLYAPLAVYNNFLCLFLNMWRNLLKNFLPLLSCNAACFQVFLNKSWNFSRHFPESVIWNKRNKILTFLAEWPLRQLQGQILEKGKLTLYHRLHTLNWKENCNISLVVLAYNLAGKALRYHRAQR